MQWLGNLGGQKRDGRFPMLGKYKGEGETSEYLAKHVDIKIVSLVQIETKR